MKQMKMAIPMVKFGMEIINNLLFWHEVPAEVNEMKSSESLRTLVS